MLGDLSGGVHPHDIPLDSSTFTETDLTSVTILKARGSGKKHEKVKRGINKWGEYFYYYDKAVV